MTQVKMFIHFYLCHPLVLSSPTLMMHGHMNLNSSVGVFSKIPSDPIYLTLRTDYMYIHTK